MGTYIATARSNYFEVKDPAAFEQWCKTRGLNCWCGDARYPNHYAIAPDATSDDGGWSWSEDEDGDRAAFDASELVPHLAPDAVAIVMEVGAEKLRYLVGHAVAINAQGQSVVVSLDDIYGMAQKAFGNVLEITPVEY